MRVRILEVDLRVGDCRTRIPFRFGMHTLTATPQLTARLLLEIGSDRVEGFAADLLVPRWFEKDPDRTIQQDVVALMESARAAAVCYLRDGDSAGATLFDLWQRVYQDRVGSRPAEAADRLVRGFGVALLERAAMDGLCRHAGCSFRQALAADLFGFRPGEIHPELIDWDPASSPGGEPARRIEVRHTVGMVDPLEAAEVVPEQRVEDGLPTALEQDIREYGLSCFKLKLSGELEADRQRLLRFAEVAAREVGGPFRYSVDGNEQFADLSVLTELFRGFRQRPRGAALLEGLLFIEQPLPRQRSLEEAQRGALWELAAIAPVILDEADSGIDVLPRALEFGYGGISVKNCKGVFRGLLNRGVVECGGRGFLTAEDLTTTGVLPLQQDLATVLAHGLSHLERNGHHYFRGLDHLPVAEAEAALAAHGDLYRRVGDTVALRIEQGMLSVGSLECAGFGTAIDIRWRDRMPLDEWSPPL